MIENKKNYTWGIAITILITAILLFAGSFAKDYIEGDLKDNIVYKHFPNQAEELERKLDETGLVILKEGVELDTLTQGLDIITPHNL